MTPAMATPADPFTPIDLLPEPAPPEPPAATAPAPAWPMAAPVVARLLGWGDDGQPQIFALPWQPALQLPARSTVALAAAMAGCEVLVVFASGDLAQPVIVGVLQPPVAPPAAAADVLVDGVPHAVTADRELVLRCGQASITLTHEGRVLIKGSYVLSRSSGYNKIKGAAVEIN